MGTTSEEVITIDSDSDECNYSSSTNNVGGCYMKFHLDDCVQLKSDKNEKDNLNLDNNKPIKNVTKIINEYDLDGKDEFTEGTFFYNGAESDEEYKEISEESNQSTEAIENKDNKKYKCDECDKSYTNSRSLQRHEKTHGITTFECDRCNKCFSQLSSLKNHRQTHPPLECLECFLVFSSQTEFDEHVESHAPPVLKRKKKEQKEGKKEKSQSKPESQSAKPSHVPQFACHICKWDSKSFYKLRAHCVKSHKIVLYQCNYCYEILKSKDEKVKHKDYDCPKNEFKCRSCLKRFPYDSTLKRHRTMCESRKSIETQTEKENENENLNENQNNGDEIVTLSD